MSEMEAANRWAPASGRVKNLFKSALLRGATQASWALHCLQGRAARRGRCSMLMYHRVAPITPGVSEPTINVTPQQFERQIAGLQQRGFEFWPLRRVLADAQAGRPLHDRVVALTFDDAFQSIFVNAWPVLKRLGVPATVFVNTAYLDYDGPMPFDHWGLANRTLAPPETYRAMTNAQARELLDSGLMELGAHTHTHQDFRGRPDDLRQDLQTCVAQLRSEFGVESPTFAFPYGTPRMGFTSEELVEAAKATGVVCGLTTQASMFDPASDPFTWGRFNAFTWDTAATLEAKLDGCYSWAPHQRERIGDWLQQLQPASESAARPTARSLAAATQDAAPHLERLPATCREPAAESSAPTAVAELPVKLPKISVIVPTFNRSHWLRDALQTLTAQQTDDRFTFDVVVIDNASADDTATVVRDFAATSDVPVHYVHQTKPGDAPTRNAGLRASDSDWFAFFDDDQLAEPDWLKELYSGAEAAEAAVVGGPVHLDLPQEELERIGPICRKALREISYYDRLHPYVNKALPGTGNALVSREVFEHVGLFDESMTSGGSDSDFFIRAREAGYPLWYTPYAVIRHRITRNRLTSAYLRWDALSGGAGHAAHFDLLKKGRLAMFAICGLRVLHAFSVNAPLYLFHRLLGNAGSALGRRTLLWRTEGYVRKTLAVLAPGWFGQREFFESLEFRRGREVGQEDESDDAP